MFTKRSYNFKNKQKVNKLFCVEKLWLEKKILEIQTDVLNMSTLKISKK